MTASNRDIGHFRDAVIIGRGGFGAVYRATDPDHGRDVAIKVLSGELDDAARHRFARERQTMGRLSAHPNIVAIYESGYTAADEAYLVMELAEGGSLRQRLTAGGPLPWEEAAEVMAAIALAVHAAHEHGVLHRDIKPDNILIDRFGNPKLTDFGIATVTGSVTAATSTTATLAHAAPELLRGEGSTPAVDIYALGSTLFSLLNGRSPFLQDDNDTVSGMIGRAMSQPPPDLRPLGVPDRVARVVERALAKSPADRQSSAAQLSAELRASVAGGGPDAATRRVDETPPGRPYQGLSGTETTTFLPDSAATTGRGMAGRPLATGADRSTGSGSAGRRSDGRSGSWGLVAVLVLLMGVAGLVGVRLINGARDDGTGADPTSLAVTPSSTEPDPGSPSVSPSSDPSAAGPTVTIDCPSEVPLGVETVCDIVSTGATSGSWHLPGFLPAPEEVTTVPGRYPIFVQPTDDAALGQLFTITATVSDDSGAEATAEHRFEVVAGDQPTVEITCPDEIPLGQATVCDILSTNATSGRWDLPEFGAGALELVPGSSPITITPDDASAVGRSFTLTATVTDDEGAEATTSVEITVVDENSVAS